MMDRSEQVSAFSALSCAVACCAEEVNQLIRISDSLRIHDSDLAEINRIRYKLEEAENEAADFIDKLGAEEAA